MKPQSTLRLAVACYCFCPLFLAIAQDKANPKLSSLFPLGGRPGATVRVAVRGENLAAIHAVWFDCDAFEAKVEGIETVDPEDEGSGYNRGKPKEKKQLYRVRLRVRVDPQAAIGVHALRLISPLGVSSPLSFLVNAEPLILENESLQSLPQRAQRVNFPAVVNGRISEPGELDFYEFKVGTNQRLALEVLTGAGPLEGAPTLYNQPHLILFESSGSWFDPQGLSRVEAGRASTYRFFSDHSVFLPRLTHQFRRPGRYVAQVGTLQGRGGPDYSYQLRIVPVGGEANPHGQWFPGDPAHAAGPTDWQERNFSRRIKPDRLRQLWARTAGEQKHGAVEQTPANATLRAGRSQPPPSRPEAGHELSHPPQELETVQESEPNDHFDRADQIALPGMIEGTIQRPGDVDGFKFQVKSGQALAFEIETPVYRPPYFSPLLTVLTEKGEEILSNIYRQVGGDGDDWIKSLQAKTIYTFEKTGAYYLQIRDLTSQRSGPQFRYRLLVRSQVPHMGEVAARAGNGAGRADQISLVPGAATKLTVVTEQEEGFQGEILLSLDRLPAGVQAFAAATTTVNQRLLDPGKKRGSMYKERFFPQRRLTTLMLVANAGAAATALPRKVQLMARPVVDGRAGVPLPVQEMLVMVSNLGEAAKATGEPEAVP